jgi:hypothetical protein
MQILSGASVSEVKRLLDLFPATNLWRQWPDVPIITTKEELSLAIATQGDFPRIVTFLEENFSACKQHVYIFASDMEIQELPAKPEGSERMIYLDAIGAQAALYLARVQFKVVLTDPPEATTIDFLWPFKIEVFEGHVIARFVILEKKLASYFSRTPYGIKRSVEEAQIVAAIVESLNLKPVDLHKGIKALWDNGFMDAIFLEFKKSQSKSSETMDKQKGLRATDPALYESVKNKPLLSAIFAIDPKEHSEVSNFTSKPSDGLIAFTKYTDGKEDVDNVLRKILLFNK